MTEFYIILKMSTKILNILYLLGNYNYNFNQNIIKFIKRQANSKLKIKENVGIDSLSIPQ